MSIISNKIIALADIHCCLSSNAITCYSKRFAQIEMFFIQWYASASRRATSLLYMQRSYGMVLFAKHRGKRC